MGKHKKVKKQKIKKRKHSNSEGSSDSSSTAESPLKWEIKKSIPESSSSTWLTDAGESMNDFINNVSHRTVAHLSKKQIEQESERRHTASVARSRELNPFLSGKQIGGVSAESSSSLQVDVRWLRRAHERAVERSHETDCKESVREILLQRYSPQQVSEMIRQFGEGSSKNSNKKSTHQESFQNPEEEEKRDIPSDKYGRDSGRMERGYDKQSRRRSRSRSRSYERKNRTRRSPENYRRYKIHSHMSQSSPTRSRSSSPQQKHRPNDDMKHSSVEASSSVSPAPVPIEERHEEKYVTDEDINKMAAQLAKAEVMSDKVKIAKIRNNLEKLREAKRRGIKIRQKVISSSTTTKNVANVSENVTMRSRSGVEMPVIVTEKTQVKGPTRIASHNNKGERISYFHADESKTSVQELVFQERTKSGSQHVREFVDLMAKAGPDVEEGEYADAFVKCKSRLDKADDRERRLSLGNYKRHQKGLENCLRCIEKRPQHLIISRGQHFYLSLPSYESLCPGHCLLTPIEHVSNTVQMDEDAWRELFQFQRQLTLMFQREKYPCDCGDEDESPQLTARSLLMMETVKLQHPTSGSWGHTQIECFPIPVRDAPLLKGYYKKALQEAGPEWSTHRKVIELKPYAPLSSAIPPGFSYFAVFFSESGCHGFSHVIEDESKFSDFFGREVLADILEVGPEFWRKPKEQSFSVQSRKVMEFLKWWQPYDDWRKDDEDL